MADLTVRVTPRASRDHVGRLRDGLLAVRVTRPAAEGEANRAVIRVLAQVLGVPAGRILLIGGERSRIKRIRVEGFDEAALERRLARLGDG